MIDLEPIAEHDRELGFSGTPIACRHFPIFRDLAHGVAANRQKHDLLAHLHALQRIDDVNDDLEMLEKSPANKKKLEKAIKEFRSYIEANQALIANYGD